MARIDEKFTEALGNFNKALEGIVETLKEQVNRKDTDILEAMLKNMDEKKIGKIVEDLKEIKETSKRIETKQDRILEEIKQIKKGKEGGVFGEVSDPKSKGKIIDGIKIITLIAGGVLAIGLAFKLIGKVDVLSVIGLGISISLMAVTFSYLNDKLKGVSIGRTFAISGMMVIMSMAILVSSKILQFTAPMSLKTMISISFTAIAVGAALYLMTEAVSKIKFNMRTIFGLILLPFLAPIVSTAIVVSSHILKQAATMDFRTILSVTFTSIALGISLYAITTAISKMNMKSSVISFLTRGAIFGTLIGAVAGGIVLASWLFSKITPISVMQGLTAIFTAITLGIVMYAMSKVIQFAEGISVMKVLAIGLLIPVVAWTIVKGSEILKKVVPFGWGFAVGIVVTSLAIGLALLAIVPAWKMLSNSWFSKATAWSTAKNILIVAGTIVAVSWIFSLGNFRGPIPDFEWSFKVGMSLVVFGGFMVGLGKVMDAAGFAQGLDIKDFMNIMIVAGSIMATSWILSMGNYTNFPPIEWVTNVGISMVLFGGSMATLGWITKTIGPENLTFGALATIVVSAIIMASSWILSVGNYGTYPTLEWSAGVGLSLLTFGTAMIGLGAIMFFTAGLGFVGLALGGLAALMVADTIVGVAKVLSTGSFGGGPSLEWAMGTGMMITTVGASMLVMGTLILGTLGLGWVALEIGAAATLLVADTIVNVSKKIAGGNFTGGPTMEWGMGTAALMTGMGASMILLGSYVIGTLGLGWIALKTGAAASIMVAQTIVDVAGIIAGGNFTGGPKVEWAEGIGISLKAFADTLMTLEEVDLSPEDFNKTVKLLVRGIVTAAEELNSVTTIDWKSLKNFPQKEWSEGVGMALSAFADTFVKLQDSSNWLGFGGVDVEDFEVSVGYLISGIISAARRLQNAGNIFTPIPINEWVNSIMPGISTFVNDVVKTKKFETEDKNRLTTIVDGLISIVNKLRLSGNIWTPIPVKDWVESVMPGISQFVNEISRNRSFGDEDIQTINFITDGLISMVQKFRSPGDIWAPIPLKKWTDSVMPGIKSFVNGLIEDVQRAQKYNVFAMLPIIDVIISMARTLSNQKIWQEIPITWSDSLKNAVKQFTDNVILLRDLDIGVIDMFRFWATISSITNTNDELNGVTWFEIPPSWTININNAVFGYMMSVVTLRDMSINEPELHRMDMMVNSMIHTAKTFNKNKEIWNNAPPKDWVDSVVYSTIQLTSAVKLLSDNVTEDSLDLLPKLAFSVVKFSSILAGASFFNLLGKLFGKESFISNFTTDLSTLIKSLPTEDQVKGLYMLGDAISKISGFGISNAIAISMLSSSIKELSKTMGEVDLTTSMDNLTKFSSSFTTLSLIDNMKLQETIDIIKNKRLDIKAVMDDSSGSSRFTGVVPYLPGQTTQVQSPLFDSTIISDPLSDLIGYNKSMDRNIKELLDIKKAEAEEAGTSYSTSAPTSFKK